MVEKLFESRVYNISLEDDLSAISKIVNKSELEIKNIVERTLKNKEKSYAPYSKFRVGCVLLTKNNEKVDGVNVENISYGLSICSERSAMVSAISLGIKPEDFELFSVCTDKEEFLTPCGACRQFMSEFPSIKFVLIVNNSGLIRITTVKELIPFVFETEDLKK